MNEFEMPKDLNPPRVPGFDPPVSKYAPKKVLANLEYELSRTDDQLIEEIKGLIKKLTHRQMREMCAAIAGKADSITKIELPDVMDRFAHGD